MTSQRLWLARGLLGCLVLIAPASVLATPSLPQDATASVATDSAQSGLQRMAQNQTPQPQAGATDANAPAASDEPIGNVASVTGVATVTRNNAATPLKLKDDIYLNDVVQTSVSSSLGITFNDATTFRLSANSRITIDNYVYEEGGGNNTGTFDIARGTVAFVAAAVAKTGNMQITTPTATLGIRGTTGVVEVPEGATATTNNVDIKLYPDADGRVGHIEVSDRQGARLGTLTQGASGFSIRPGVGGARFAAVALTISPQQRQRDQGFVRQVYATQTLGRRIVTEQRAFRRANPGLNNRNNPQRQPGQPQQPGQNRRGQGGRPQPGQNRPGQPQQPGTPNNRQDNRQDNRQGQQQPQRTNQPGSGQRGQPRTGQNAQPTQPGAAPRPGQAQPGTTRGGQNTQPTLPAQPGGPARPNVQPRQTGPAAPPLPKGQPLLRQGGRPQFAPGAPRPGLLNRPGTPRPRQGPSPKDKKRP